MKDFLVIGAGLAGIACAADLQSAGHSVQVVDKGRGVGGRTATRRFGDTRVDHGAQYFTARTPRLQALVADGIADGWLKEWCRGYPTYESGQIHPRPPGHPRYVGPQGMSDLPKHLAQNLPVEVSATITSLIRLPDGSGYTAFSADGRVFSGRRIVLNLPPVQLLALARPLLPASAIASLETVTYDPAWTLMLRLEADIPGADWPALEIKNHPVLGIIARDHTRRAPGAPPVLVAHGTGSWSRAHLEDDSALVEVALTAALAEIVGQQAVVDTQVHRWRYAQPTNALPDPFLLTPDGEIGGCGDWCAPGGRVEGALESGWNLAAALQGGK